MHSPTIDLTATDAAVVKLFECIGALKGAASFFVLDQGIDSVGLLIFRKFSTLFVNFLPQKLLVILSCIGT